MEAVRGGGTVRLAAGIYRLESHTYLDSTCANCERADTLIHATRALLVTGRGVRIVGVGRDRTVLHTGAGYGVLFDGCDDCRLDSLAVTGGERDTSGSASSAAVVVKGGRAALRGLLLRDNLGDSATVRRVVVGIAGVAARDGADIEVRDCRITRNSWDGIALYRGARARIEGNWIDGVDRAVGGRHGGGRGVGIGVTWDARAEIRGNAVRRYWKGIGAFVDADVVAEENVVEEIATWGMTLWDADRGRPRAVFARNAIFRTGACGVAVWRGDSISPEPGAIVGNLVIQSGQDARYDSGDVYCSQRALALDKVPMGLKVEGNLLHANREPGGKPGTGDLDREGLVRQSAALIQRLGGWAALRETSFLRELGPPPGGVEGPRR